MTGTIPSQGTVDLLLSEPSLLSLPLLTFCLHAQDLLIEMQIAEAQLGLSGAGEQAGGEGAHQQGRHAPYHHTESPLLHATTNITSPVLHLQDLLIEMQNAEAHSLDYLALASVLVAGARSGEDAIRATALRWLAVIIAAAKAQLLPLYASILQAILPALSSTLPDILEVWLRWTL